jgi:hypothetical protein
VVSILAIGINLNIAKLPKPMKKRGGIHHHTFVNPPKRDDDHGPTKKHTASPAHFLWLTAGLRAFAG